MHRFPKTPKNSEDVVALDSLEAFRSFHVISMYVLGVFFFLQILHDIVPSHELMIDFNTMLQKSSKSLNIFALFLSVNLEYYEIVLQPSLY